MEVVFKTNIAEVVRDLRKFEKRQVPFAVAQALTATAFDVRKRTVGRSWQRGVQVRNKRFPSAVMRVEKATKRKLRSSVLNPKGKLERRYLGLVAEGGIRRPVRGRHLTVPESDNVKRTATGKIPKAKRPRVVRDRPDVFVEAFKRPHPAIWQRTRSGIKLLYSMVQSVPMPASWRFYQDATSTATRVFPYQFRRWLARAIATARF